MHLILDNPVALIAAGVALAAIFAVVLLAFWPGRYDRAGILNGNRYRITRIIALITASWVGIAFLVESWQIVVSETVRVPMRGPGLGIGSELNDLDAAAVDAHGPTLHVEPPQGSVVILGVEADQGVVNLQMVDPMVRFWLVVNMLFVAALAIMIAVAVAKICSALLRAEPFQNQVTTWIRISAWTFLGAGIGAQIATSIAQGLVVAQVSRREMPEDFLELGDPWGITGGWRFVTGSWGYEFNPWPIGVCLALLALSAVFNAGTRLRRDVDGLV